MEKVENTRKREVEFIRLRIRNECGSILHNVYYPLRNGRSPMMESFRKLERHEQALIIDLISKMATVQNFKSNMIRYRMKKYSYGEVTPHSHRFFFFQKYGKNIIFFGYVLKKKDSLNDEFYKELEKEKVFYEREFEKFLNRRD